MKFKDYVKEKKGEYITPATKVMMKKYGIDPEKERKKGKSEKEIMVMFFRKYLPQRP